MDVRTPLSIISIVFISSLATACCQQPTAHRGGGGGGGGGNCHTHTDNASRGTTRHCHAHVNGSNHTHTYGNKKAPPRSNYRPQPKPKPQNNNYNYDNYPTYYDTKKKGYYRGDVGSVIDPYAKNVLRDYREY